MARSAPVLARFQEPTSVVSFLARRDADLDEVDGIYGALVVLAQDDNEAAKLASALIWIGLRPALDRIYRWRLRLADSPDAAASEVVHLFSEVVDRADPRKIKRVASTLVRNTKRDLVEQRRRDRLEPPTDLSDALPDPRQDCNRRQLFVAGPRASTDDELHLLRERLQQHLGENADVVLGAAVLEASHVEVAMALGISYQGFRKRYPAAMRRLRRHIEGTPQRPLPNRCHGARVTG